MIIDVHNLVKRYHELTALNHVDLKVEKKEILGLLGPNGSGKSTMINCILSLISYDLGEIKVFDQIMKPDSYEIKKRIGIVPQEIAFFQELTVQENISYYCGLYIKDRNQVKKNVNNVIELVGLEDFMKFYPKQLSGGLARRLNIACDVAHQEATIVYTTHYVEEVELLCNRIVILDHGSIIAQGSAEELKEMVKANEKIIMTIPLLTSQQQQQLFNQPAVQEINYSDFQLEITSTDLRQTMLPMLEYLESKKINYGNLHTKEVTLNDVFLTITGRKLRDRDD